MLMGGPCTSVICGGGGEGIGRSSGWAGPLPAQCMREEAGTDGCVRGPERKGEEIIMIATKAYGSRKLFYYDLI